MSKCDEVLIETVYPLRHEEASVLDTRNRIDNLIDLLYWSAKEGCVMWDIPFTSSREALEVVPESWWEESVKDIIDNTIYTAREINTAFKIMVGGKCDD